MDELEHARDDQALVPVVELTLSRSEVCSYRVMLGYLLGYEAGDVQALPVVVCVDVVLVKDELPHWQVIQQRWV